MKKWWTGVAALIASASVLAQNGGQTLRPEDIPWPSARAGGAGTSGASGIENASQPADPVRDQCLEQPGLVPKELVERCQRSAGATDHVREAGGAVALLDEEIPGGLKEGLPPRFPPRGGEGLAGRRV